MAAMQSPATQYVVILPRDVGFFSLFFQVISELHECDASGRLPIVYFNRRCLYWSDGASTGSESAWDRYFEPLSGAKIQDVLSWTPAMADWSAADFRRDVQVPNVTFTDAPPVFCEWENPALIESQRPVINSLIKKHIRVRARLATEVEGFARREFDGARVLGLHLRGLEQTLTPVGHLARPLDVFDRYLHFADRYLAAYPDARIFAATDSESLRARLLSKYGERIIDRSTTRLAPSQERIGLHYLDDSHTDKSKLGDDVLIDALLLSRCDYFIHGMSNVAFAALHFNPSLEHLNVDVACGWVLASAKSSIGRGALRRFTRPLRKLRETFL